MPFAEQRTLLQQEGQDEVRAAPALTKRSLLLIVGGTLVAGVFGGYVISGATKEVGLGPLDEPISFMTTANVAPALDNYEENLAAPPRCACIQCDGKPYKNGDKGNWCAAKASPTGQQCVTDTSNTGCYSTLSDYDCNCPDSVSAKIVTGIPTACSCLECGVGADVGSWTSGVCAAASSPAGQTCKNSAGASGCVSSLDDYDCNCPGTVGSSRLAVQTKFAKKAAAGREVFKRDNCGLQGNNYGSQMTTLPIFANNSCGCAALCSNTVGCAGWTWAPVYGSVDATTGLLMSCFLRSSWGTMVDAASDGCPADNPCYSAPVDDCGMPWNFAAKQQSTVTATSSCECREACDKVEECDAWTYYYNYNDGKDNCWLMNWAEDGSNTNCLDECFSGQKVRAKCGAGRYLQFNSKYSVVMYTFTAYDPCDCSAECLRMTGECMGWTYKIGSGTTIKGAEDNKCILYSTAGTTESCTDCVSDYVSTHAKQIDAAHQARTNEELAKSEAALEKTVCAQTTEHTGNFSYIASGAFQGVAPWPTLDQTAYTELSKLLTTLGVQSEHITFSTDVRSTYPLVIGTSVVAVYQATLGNYYVMEAARTKAGVDAKAWAEAAAQLADEVRGLQVVGDWFDVYAELFAMAGAQVFEAFTTTAAIVSMPGTTQVTSTKVHGWKIALKVLEVVGQIGLVVATDGGYLAADGAEKAAKDADKGAKDAEKGAKDADKGAKDAKEADKAVHSSLDKINFLSQNLVWVAQAASVSGQAANIAPATAGGENPVAAADATVSEYYDFIAKVQTELNTIWRSVAAEKLLIAGNYGRLSTAAAAAGGCPITPDELHLVISQTYGAMQWIALGVLLPTKYAIYWQRDYMGTKGPNCYYNNCGGGTSGDQCGTSSSSVLGCVGTTMGCFEPSESPYDKSQIKGGGTPTDAKRFVWMGQQNNPSEVPSEDMWAAIDDGPISSYINQRFKTMYTGSYGAFEAFMSQCQYVSKLYIPGGDITYSETQVSSVKVDCDVYGITIPTYALIDCGTQMTDSNVVWNGFGINSDGSSGDATGNFNQMTYIPNKPNSWATFTDGEVGCCLPWNGAVSLPEGCDYILCDCYSLAVMSSNGDVSGDGEGSSTTSGTWWNSCSVDTSSPSEKQYVQTSFGADGPWPRIITSGNSFSSMQGLESVVIT